VSLLTAAPALAEPSPSQLRAQQRRAAQLDQVAEDAARGTAAAQRRLAELAVTAARSMDAFAAARDEARAARAEEATQRSRLEAAQLVVHSERQTIGRLAASAYRNGGSAGRMAMFATLLDSASPTDLGRAAADLQWAGSQQSYAVDRVEAARAAVAEVAAAAAAAKARAEAAELTAREAKEQADGLVAEQQALVALLDERAAQARGAADRAQVRAEQMERARAVAAERRAAAAVARRAAVGRGEVVLGDGTCAGADVSGYPNGQIPRSALCPLWGAEWQVLRADAAATFNALSQAYAARFGRPICVTDSYRTLEMQVDVHRRKPNMTAVPGTSNHGWGTAVDLCDGVNRFDSPTHAWMQANAPRFGWFHPGWARAGSTRPEPWHWEFAG
jgi:hypothetical protein